MKRIIITMAVAAAIQCLTAAVTFAQLVQDLPYEKIHTINRTAVSYQHEREADAMASKIVWRRIELTEKANQHLYFPTTPQDGRMSLIDVLLEGIHTQGLTAYKESDGNEFASIITEKEVLKQMGSTEMLVEQIFEDSTVLVPVPVPYNSAEIKSYLIKEVWYYDKQRSVMDIRIAGICPLRTYYRDDDVDQEHPILKKTFWIYYPEARGILAKAECFNIKNDAARLSFDDIFQKRIFSGYIFAESNIYNNRNISEYTRGAESLYEAERIKNTIFNGEQDIWEN